jgi:hypothetical protein
MGVGFNEQAPRSAATTHSSVPRRLLTAAGYCKTAANRSFAAGDPINDLMNDQAEAPRRCPAVRGD